MTDTATPVSTNGGTVPRELINQFPVDIPSVYSSQGDVLTKLEKVLMRDLAKNSDTRRIEYKNTGVVEMQKFFPKLSKPILDLIDIALARSFGITENELDFVINYDIKYRMGSDAEDEEA